MTKEEVVNLFMLIEKVYPYCIPKSETVSLWFAHCHEIDHEEVAANLKAHIRKSPYPPACSDLSAFLTLLREGNTQLSWKNEYEPRKGA